MISSKRGFRLVLVPSFWVLVFLTNRKSQIKASAATITSAPPTSVTIYEVEPSWFSDFDTADARPIDGTFELDVSIVGVSSDSSGGSETTYSFGEYISNNFVFTTTITSQGQIITETVKTPDIVETRTIVESAAGAWMTVSAFIASNGRESEEGEYLSCAFDSTGGTSASCTDIDFEPFVTTISGLTAQTTSTGLITFSSTYGGFKTGLTVLTEAVAIPSPTSAGFNPTPASASNSARRMDFGFYWVLVLCYSISALYMSCNM